MVAYFHECDAGRVELTCWFRSFLLVVVVVVVVDVVV